MFVYLVHHGEAVAAEVDPQRPLSERGRKAVDNLAFEAARRGVRPAAVWHSGKLRARQTAQAFWHACNPLAEFTAVKGLQPDDSPELIVDLLTGEQRDVVLAGHMPSLPAILRRLMGHATATMPLHGMVALERTESGFIEHWRLDAPAG